MENFILNKQWLIANKKGRIEDTYQFTNKLLGSGTFGTVLKGRLKGQTNHISWRAIKKIPKIKVSNKFKFLNEIEILQKLDHPNIIKLYETFQDQNHIYLVTEICTGGELFDKIIQKGYFTQEETRVIFKQIMLALNYCHSQKIAHRDLKPQNFLFSNRSKDSTIKLIDFGFSLNFDSQSSKDIKTMVGSSYYIAPEAINGVYNQKCDIWSIGVILYMLLTGVPPFNGDSDQEIFEMIKNKFYTFEIPQMEGVSESVKNLISSILVEPEKRPTTQQILNHPWVTHGASTEPLHINMNKMKQFSNFGKLKKIVVMMIASQVNDKQIFQLQRIFKSADTNHDGLITINQLKQIVSKQQQELFQLDSILEDIEIQNNGAIKYSYFVASCLKESTFLKEDNIKMIFQMMDVDKDGRISKEELSSLFSKAEDYGGEDHFVEMIKEGDKNGDGYIDYNEFVEMMSETSA